MDLGSDLAMDQATGSGLAMDQVTGSDLDQAMALGRAGATDLDRVLGMDQVLELVDKQSVLVWVLADE